MVTSDSDPTPTTVLGLGAMGRAIAARFHADGHPLTVWNRTPGRADELVAAGATRAATAAEAAAASPLVVVCLLDQESVRDVLHPIAATLAGRVVVNLTSTTPDEARENAAWAAEHGIDYLDGGIMAIPEMIGRPEAFLLYSGSRTAFDSHRGQLERLGAASYLSEDAGIASLYDFALLAAMYVMFVGFYHGAAMVATAGVPATEFAALAGPWLRAMTEALPLDAEFVDRGDYTTDVQSLDFNRSGVDAILRASEDLGLDVTALASVKALVDRQIAAGHGAEAFARIIEGIRPAG